MNYFPRRVIELESFSRFCSASLHDSNPDKLFPPKNPEITVGVIDDDIFEEDEYFYVHLSNPRVAGYPETGAAPPDSGVTPKAVLGDNHTATVTIYDDDHAGKSTPPSRDWLL